MLILLARQEEAALRKLQSCVEECYTSSQIAAFTDVEAAVRYASLPDRCVDLCFTGVQLKSGTGIGLFRRLRSLDRKIQGVLIADSDAYALDAWQAHFSDYLIEPLDVQKVQHTVESCVCFTGGAGRSHPPRAAPEQSQTRRLSMCP